MDVTPEYFPRLETLLPILREERAVWRADRPFSRQGWQNRTRLRNPDGWQWITVPVEHGQLGQSIAITRIAYHDGWRKRHLKAFQYNYSSSPFYEHYASDLQVLLSARHETLHALNKAALDMILGWLQHDVAWEIRTEPESLSIASSNRLCASSSRQDLSALRPVSNWAIARWSRERACRRSHSATWPWSASRSMAIRVISEGRLSCGPSRVRVSNSSPSGVSKIDTVTPTSPLEPVDTGAATAGFPIFRTCT